MEKAKQIDDAQGYVEKIEAALREYLPAAAGREEKLMRAMEYSLLAGGKRVRPVLTLAFCRLCGGDVEAALPFACAVEMIHTYSLIHDDLPCMDDDDMRRGRPSNHVAFDEATALLAGDALLTLAFERMLCAQSIALVGAERAARAAGILATQAGWSGMVAGQVIDLMSEGRQVTLEQLKEMDEKKTGALIWAAVQIGCEIAGAPTQYREAAGLYARNVGLAFQIVDDILDQTADAAQLGKPIGSDAANDKATYVSLLGLERCQELAQQLTAGAVKALDVFDGDTSFLRSLAQSLAQRKK